MDGMRRGDHEGVKAVLNRWVFSSFLKVVWEEASRMVGGQSGKAGPDYGALCRS